MWIICLTPLEPGVYNDVAGDHITTPPEGWAVIPDGFPLPSTYPRLGSIEAEARTYTREVKSLDKEGKPTIGSEEYTMLTVTAMTEGTLPEPEPAPAEPAEVITDADMAAAIMEGVNEV